ncbi:MAG: hypothetical protein HOG03_14390 [Desulfobacula sp.]|jgi:hypothetical protein|uniref:hypothetical protein n=1 Tax=Desulfobacula sp. TaxID=2593537 RepID=UPI001DE608E9|nr:hypothetical protein [Desulfobacula sp.]MBT3486575.1 hypothetical protein [Desulfobacula sp.]MBT3805766.1 hypothetical protein [Desulfobacula sp.]MBT4023949.1 hypothetical protein [Desulfobacula sp.]MBT4200355.1 hypothetical protein [Desulfobacula sp.]
MKDKALRRHQEFKAKIKSQKNYNSCIPDLPESERQELENNIEKLKKVCISSHLEEKEQNYSKKPLQVRKHDISMREQLN